MDKIGVYYNLGLECLSKKEHRKGIEAFTELIKLEPNHGDSYFQLGCIYFDKEDYDEALKNYTLSLEYNSSHISSVYYNMALIFQNEYENYDKAKRYYQLSLQNDPKKSEAHNNLGLLLQYYFKEYAVAKKHFMEAIRHDSRCSYYYYNLGLWYELYDDSSSVANQYYQIGYSYVDNTDDISNMYYNLGLWLQQIVHDSSDQVSKIFNLALQFNPNRNNLKKQPIKTCDNDVSDDDQYQENELLEISSLSFFKKLQKFKLIKKNQLNNDQMYLLF